MANPYLSLLKTSWKYARQEKKRYALVYSMFVCANLLSAINPILFGWFIGNAQKNGDRILHYTLVYVLCYTGLKLGQWCFHGPARIMERTLAFYLSRNFLQERYHQVLHLPVKWQQENHSGATINRIRKAYEALREFFDHGFMYLNALTKFVFSMIAILYFSPFFGSIAVLMGLLTILIIRKFDKPFIRALEEVNEKEHIVSSTLFDSLSNIMTVITLRLEKSMESGLLRKVEGILHPFRKSALINEWKWFSAEMMIVCIYGMITTGYIFQHHVPGTVFYVGGLVTLLAYVNQFTSVFQDIAWQYTEIIQYNTYVETASVISEAYRTKHRADDPLGFPAEWRSLEIRALNFSHRNEYDSSQRAHSLHDIQLRIRRGERIALIGESGSGKSSVLALLRGLYVPEKDTIVELDGKTISLDRINEGVTLIPQEPEIFENTLSYNITLGLPFSDKEVLDVCKQAHFTEVVDHLPLRLDSDIREKGVNLSGGQKQRLALARGILAARDSALVLLDEPTSSVDPKTESLIYDNLFDSFSDKAIISSMHRLHLLAKFNYVYVLQQGRIVDEGNFEQLRANSQVFQELWKHQHDPDNIRTGKIPS